MNRKYNASGCLDPTAYAVIENGDKEDKKFRKVLRAIFDICELAGFQIQGRIVLMDKKTGRVWR